MTTGQSAINPSVNRPAPGNEAPLVAFFPDLDRTSLPLVGGKGANLGELTRAGLPVPPGFCVTTRAYALAAQTAAMDALLETHLTAATLPDARDHAIPPTRRPAETTSDALARSERLASAAREALLAARFPVHVAEAIRGAYHTLGGGRDVPVAVRSSATAEDLPTASFAGQQDTYLNVVGIEAVLDACRRCWASLWTDRAVTYRESNGIDHRTVQLAVVIQQMVDARVAGVLFTANPLTGRRHQAVIDANPGLGEAVVSGAVNPDHFVVNTEPGEIVERRLGDKRLRIESLAGGGTRRVESGVGQSGPGQSDTNAPCLSDAQIRELARLGAQVEAHYGAPQDCEWALDDGGMFWLVQARPITTLYPLPAGTPHNDQDLRVYFSVNVAQGVLRPFTPMGIQGLRLVGSSISRALGYPPRDATVGPSMIVDAGGRLFLDVTVIVRNPLGRRLARFALGKMEARTGVLLEQLLRDPRLAPLPGGAAGTGQRLALALLRTGIPLRVVQALRDPASAPPRLAAVAREVLAPGNVPEHTGAAQRLEVAERLMVDGVGRVAFRALPLVAAGQVAFELAWRLLGDLSTSEERETVRRGVPHNPTTEMDLELWGLADRIRADAPAAAALRATSPAALAALAVVYRQGTLPAVLQAGLAAFLDAYGHRGVAEIDLGLPRWGDDPAHILGVLANYLQLDRPEQTPATQFAAAARAAEAMVETLTRRARRRSPLHGRAVAFLLGRGRVLAGLREAPKFYFVAALASMRALVWPVGNELAARGRIAAADDIFFLTLPEARAGLAGADLRAMVAERRAEYQRELQRRHPPRLLLSDGTEPQPPVLAADGAFGAGGQGLAGTPASSGVITGTARVIMDPHGARLEPGEILVAPSTDPGWTPLFLTAGGLVMEMGGPMSHGAVVAREYGIPAVVGVPGATERITTGQRITVDGARGTVHLDPRIAAPVP